jgi:hypothetical protein
VTVGPSEWREKIGYGFSRVWEGTEGVIGVQEGEVTGYWRKLYLEELRDWYPSPSIIQAIQ